MCSDHLTQHCQVVQCVVCLVVCLFFNTWTFIEWNFCWCRPLVRVQGADIGAIDYPNNARESPFFLKRWLYILHLISCRFLHLKWYISHAILTLILNKIMKQVLLFACHDSTVGHLMYCPQRETVACTTLRKTHVDSTGCEVEMICHSPSRFLISYPPQKR